MSKINSAYGIDINVTGEFADDIRSVLDVDADHCAEVHICYNGEEREYTLLEFLAQLGFKVETIEGVNDA